MTQVAASMVERIRGYCDRGETIEWKEGRGGLIRLSGEFLLFLTRKNARLVSSNGEIKREGGAEGEVGVSGVYWPRPRLRRRLRRRSWVWIMNILARSAGPFCDFDTNPWRGRVMADVWGESFMTDIYIYVYTRLLYLEIERWSVTVIYISK